MITLSPFRLSPFRLSPLQVLELCKYSTIADKETRSDLANGYIRDENDYTSNFTGTLRRNINSHCRSGLKAESFMLNTSEERRMGCDATIIIGTHDVFKIAVFEAKLPWKDGKYRANWDYEQTAAGLSHYSDQLDRQSHLMNMAVFEMFYCGFEFGKQPQHLQNEGSSCVWHHKAITFDKNRAKPKVSWKEAELIGLLSEQCLPIGSIMKSICECEEGRPLTMRGGIKDLINEYKLEGNMLFIEASPESPGAH